jgi:hypothetical protein
MNKKFFIIGGLAVILLLLGVWAYLLVYGAPTSTDDVFANLGTGGEVSREEVAVPLPVIEEKPVVNIAAGRLRQLTTGPVAGFKEVSISTSTPNLLHYVEMGTGHVYTINTQSGESTRISATTFPQTVVAEISNDGRYYAFLGASATKVAPLTIGSIATATVSITKSYEGTASAVAFNDAGSLYIMSREGDVSSAVTYTVESNSSAPLFTLPFLEATVQWNKERGGAHLVYPKPAATLEGQLYRVTGTSFTRLPIQGLGLTAIQSGDVTLYTVVENRRLISYFYHSQLNLSDPLNSPVLTEKCVSLSNEGSFICAQDRSQTNLRSQDTWYTGEVTFSDTVWLLDGNTLTGELLFDGLEESGRQLDMIELTLNPTGEVLYFINKLDNTLWMYEL